MWLPSEGVCHACYVLAYSAGLDTPPSFVELMERSHRLTCGDSFFRDLKELAQSLLEVGVMVEDRGRIHFIPEFPKCRTGADRDTKLQIAKLLLSRRPPTWLPTSGGSQGGFDSLMPTEAQNALAWMGRDLEHILQSVILPQDRHFTYEVLGRIGEELVLEAERNAGKTVRHVSVISDNYGYDLESAMGEEMRCIEVKCTLESKAGRFFLSRNEYQQSRRLAATWILVQVVLRGDAVWTTPYLDTNSVATIRFLSSDMISQEIIKDNANCSWQDTVEFQIPDNIWGMYPHRPSPAWRIPNPLVTLSL
jgi:hypothetical protein